MKSAAMSHRNRRINYVLIRTTYEFLAPQADGRGSLMMIVSSEIGCVAPNAPNFRASLNDVPFQAGWFMCKPLVSEGSIT